MDEQRFLEGERAYRDGDYKAAAREYLASVHGQPAAGTGRAYHQAGNALMKLHRYSDAITVYGHARKDAEYERVGSVCANLGAALSAEGRIEEALESYTEALTDVGYPSPWKALAGQAGALYKLGRHEEAAAAYRDASWTEGNPDPGKSLNNLGLCFMALGRPEEAIEAYKAALHVEGYAGKGKAAANLGLAYASMGFADEAVRSFESARDEHGHELTGPVLAAYERAKAAAPDASQQVEGWETGEMAPIQIDEHGWGEADAETEEQASTFDEDSRFFTMTEDEMRVADRDSRRETRRDRISQTDPRRYVIGGVIAVVVFVGSLVGSWYLGLGYPSQRSMVAGMMDAARSGGRVDEFWVAAPAVDIKEEMRHLPAEFKEYTIVGMKAGATQSVVRVTVRASAGAEPLAYDVLLVREGVGWRVNGIRNAWNSGGGS